MKVDTISLFSFLIFPTKLDLDKTKSNKLMWLGTEQPCAYWAALFIVSMLEMTQSQMTSFSLLGPYKYPCKNVNVKREPFQLPLGWSEHLAWGVY